MCVAIRARSGARFLLYLCTFFAPLQLLGVPSQQARARGGRWPQARGAGVMGNLMGVSGVLHRLLFTLPKRVFWAAKWPRTRRPPLGGGEARKKQVFSARMVLWCLVAVARGPCFGSTANRNARTYALTDIIISAKMTINANICKNDHQRKQQQL